jgi:hypothetical protein
MFLTNIESAFLAGVLGKKSASLASIGSETPLPHLLSTMSKVRWKGTQSYLAFPNLLTDIMARVSSDEAGSQSNRREKS